MKTFLVIFIDGTCLEAQADECVQRETAYVLTAHGKEVAYFSASETRAVIEKDRALNFRTQP